MKSITKDADVQTQKVAGTAPRSIIVQHAELCPRGESARLSTRPLLADHFGVDETIRSRRRAFPALISAEMKNGRDSWLTAIATACMLVYIWVRFKDIRFAASAVLALVHDVAGCDRHATRCAVWSVGSNGYRLPAHHRGIFHQRDDRDFRP